MAEIDMNSLERQNNEEEEKLIWIKRAESVLGEREPERTALLDQLRSLVSEEQGLVVPQDDAFFLKFLRAGMMSPTQALEVMKNYFKLLETSPDIFQNSANLEKLVKTTFSQQIHCMLPHRDKYGRRVYVFRPGRWDPNKIPFVDVFCVGYLLSEMVVREEETQIAGLTAIVDATGFGFKHLRAIGMEDGKKMASFFNISFPLWLRQSHVFNAPRVFHILFNMLYPFLSETVRDEVVFHSGDIASIREYFSEDMLPSDLGGTGSLGPMDNSHNVEELRTMEKYFKDLTHYGFK